jgi:hypothetical protein
VTDSRFTSYVKKFGRQSWELDALAPELFRDLIEGELSNLIDKKAWDADVKAKKAVKARLTTIKDQWESLLDVKGKVEGLEARVQQLLKANAKLKKGKGSK